MLNPNYNKHSDVNKLISFITALKVVSVRQGIAYLHSLGLNQERTNNVMSILVKSGKARYSSNSEFICTNSAFLNDASKYFCDSNKIGWLYIALAKNFNSVNIDCKYPCKAFFYNAETKNTLHIFEIRNNFLDEDCIHIDTNFSTANAMNSPINSIILIEKAEDIDRIFLTKAINILAFATVKIDESGNVDIKFYDKNKVELQVSCSG